jgi:hypothetical protein
VRAIQARWVGYDADRTHADRVYWPGKNAISVECDIKFIPTLLLFIHNLLAMLRRKLLQLLLSPPELHNHPLHRRLHLLYVCNRDQHHHPLHCQRFHQHFRHIQFDSQHLLKHLPTKKRKQLSYRTDSADAQVCARAQAISSSSAARGWRRPNW